MTTQKDMNLHNTNKGGYLLPVEGEKFMKRASGGILADGVNSMIAGIFNSFPNSIFAQNNGMIQLTGVASRYVGILLLVC